MNEKALFQSEGLQLARDHYLVIAATLMVFAFALGEWYRHFIELLAIPGFYLLVKRFDEIKSWPSMRMFFLLFLLIWAPMVLSLFDASVFKSYAVTARSIIFLLAGIACIYFARDFRSADKLMYAVAAIVGFWALDGIIQFAVGRDLFGYPLFHDGRPTGMFYPWVGVGQLTAMFLPVYFEAIYQLRIRISMKWLILSPVFMILLLSGSRDAWMLSVVSLVSYIVYFFRMGRKVNTKHALIALALGLGVAVLLATQVDMVWNRFQSALGIFSGDYATVSRATSQRIPLWDTALNMIQEHWLNGIGPRAFPEVYSAYSTAPNDPFMKGAPVRHPHLYILEVAVGTGVFGVLAYIFFLALVLYLLNGLIKKRAWQIAPWGLVLLVTGFPLSTSISLYKYFGSSLLFVPLYFFMSLSNNLKNQGVAKSKIETG